jgi:hypothetical protein
MHNHPQASIKKSNFGRLFSASYVKSATVDSNLKEFRCAGLYAYNPKFISDDKFLPSTNYRNGDPEPETCTSTALDQRAKVPLASPRSSSADVPTAPISLLGILPVGLWTRKETLFVRNRSKSRKTHWKAREKAEIPPFNIRQKL